MKAELQTALFDILDFSFLDPVLVPWFKSLFETKKKHKNAFRMVKSTSQCVFVFGVRFEN